MKATSSLFVVMSMVLLRTTPAWAHVGENLGGFESGLLHPISGLDHVVAMVAVGLWGAILGAPALWLLPIVFPMVMAVAGAAGAVGIPLPGVEIGIAMSGIFLGLMVVLATRPPLWAAAVATGIFAVFHGHAHGAELPESANAIVYAVGFVIATGLLHLMGIAIGWVGRWPAGRILVRAAGVGIAFAGGVFLMGMA